MTILNLTKRMNNPKSKKISEKKETLILAGVIFSALVTAFLVSLYVAAFGVVAGGSMSGTLEDGDLIFINKLSSEYERGDVVIVSLKELTRGTVVKRIAAVPGDSVKITDEGFFYLNGELVAHFPEGSFDPMERVLSEGEYFLLGDNLAGSADSRKTDFPKVSSEDIVGRAVFRLFPKIEKIK